MNDDEGVKVSELATGVETETVVATGMGETVVLHKWLGSKIPTIVGVEIETEVAMGAEEISIIPNILLEATISINFCHI